MAKVSVKGRNGGVLYPQQPGERGKPGAGRKPNFFRAHIHELSDAPSEIILDGHLVLDGVVSKEKVSVSVSLPGALGVVLKAFSLAAAGDAQARNWLTETGWGRHVTHDIELDNPSDTGFVIVLPSNSRDNV